jgi:hypothetical protein
MRLTAEIHDALPELDHLSYPVRFDAALAELLACLDGSCSETETWTGLGPREDPISSGRYRAEMQSALPGMTSLSFGNSLRAVLAELLAATFPCVDVAEIDHLVWVQQPTVNGEVGAESGTEPFLAPLQVAGVDADDNVVEDFTGGITVGIGDLDCLTGSLNGTLTENAVAGIATFDVTVNYFFDGDGCGSGLPSAHYTLKASSPGVSDVESDEFSFGVPT